MQSAAPLPDLVLDEAYLLDSTRFDIQNIQDPCAVQQGCATGLGERRVVRFGSRMGNVGQADFLLGAPEQQNPLWTQDSCGMRFSLAGFARYELRDASGQLVLTGTKNEFCMTDAEEWIPESGAQCHKYTCKNQGIVPGCADNYGTDLPCQWLDVTDVPAGEYELSVTVNAAHAIAEQDYANNNVKLRLRIGANGTGSVLR
ncbi:MAG TPA: lysyl oxidase family protein [Polyangiaceae bacterium]|nr:lysyl oxidase family protein [Polyangiaceae bacterium]